MKDQSLINAKTEPQNLTPLHLAAEEGYVEIVNLLLTNEADMNAVDENGNTPLHLAVLNEHISCALALLHDGADNLKENNKKQTAVAMIDTMLSKHREDALQFVLEEKEAERRDSGKNIS